MPKSNLISRHIIVFVIVISSLFAVCAQGDWLKMDPPPDVDKKTHGHNGTSTCWLAAASNMLAGAGYGTGATPQQRADNIYTQMVTTHGTGPGWTDNAIKTWLKSSYNLQKGTNPYTVVTVYGNKSATPYVHDQQGTGFNATDDLPEFIGNELRDCQMLGVSLCWPASGGGHIITGWGDSGDANSLTSNPGKLMVTDSDSMDFYGDVQTYKYSAFYGYAWYLNYNSSPFIKHVVTLCATDVNDPNAAITQKIVGSYKRSNLSSITADKILHILAANNTILTYKTVADACSVSLVFLIETNQRKNLIGWWNASIAQGESATITTEAVFPYDPNATVANKLSNFALIFGYPPPEPNSDSPGFSFGVDSIKLSGGVGSVEPNQTGGHIIGGFDVFADFLGQVPVGEFRFCVEYQGFENPEEHNFTLEPAEIFEPTWVGNFRFGHSYGLLKGQGLWNYDQWWTVEPAIQPFEMGNPPINIAINWAGQGLLPYPRGENYDAPQPSVCGDPGTEYSRFDYNEDCYINFVDFAYFADSWLLCSNPADANCVAGSP